MKKYTHPLKKLTQIQFKNGTSFAKYWVYYRAFIQDGGSFFNISKIKTSHTEIVLNIFNQEENKILLYTKIENELINEINTIKLYFK